MTSNILNAINNIYISILDYLDWLYNNPSRLIILIIDIVLVSFILIKFIQMLRDTRAWQLVKGIGLLVLITAFSSLTQLRILNYIFTSLMTYGIIFIIILFQPELRRGLEQLRNK